MQVMTRVNIENASVKKGKFYLHLHLHLFRVRTSQTQEQMQMQAREGKSEREIREGKNYMYCRDRKFKKIREHFIRHAP